MMSSLPMIVRIPSFPVELEVELQTVAPSVSNWTWSSSMLWLPMLCKRIATIPFGSCTP
jgi:hypothetical protein